MNSQKNKRKVRGYGPFVITYVWMLTPNPLQLKVEAVAPEQRGVYRRDTRLTHLTKLAGEPFTAVFAGLFDLHVVRGIVPFYLFWITGGS
jgi:hypothetical protein